MQNMDKQLLKLEMNALVEGSLLHEQVKKKLREFIDYKEAFHFTFGELTIVHYYAFGGKGEYIYKLAACVELLVLCSDIIDDLQDQDNTTAPWYHEPESIVLNIALGVLSLCNMNIVDLTLVVDNRYEIIKTFQEFCLQSIKGQHVDILNDICTEEGYIEMVKFKAGGITALACLVGSLCAPISNYNLALVKKYAEQIGVIAQINNDIEDVLRPTEKNDFITMRKTLPILYVMNNHNQISAEIMAMANSGPSEVKKLLQPLIQMIEDTGAIQYAKVVRKINEMEAHMYMSQLDIDNASKDRITSFII